MIQFVLSTEAHARHIGENIRPCDRDELAASCGEDPVKVTVESLHRSLIAWTALKDGVPIAIFGVVPNKGDGIVWLLGTPQVDRERRAFLTEGRRYVALMSTLFPVMYNAVLGSNSTSRRWLRALGFVEEETFPAFGVLKVPFVFCVYRKPHV